MTSLRPGVIRQHNTQNLKSVHSGVFESTVMVLMNHNRKKGLARRKKKRKRGKSEFLPAVLWCMAPGACESAVLLIIDSLSVFSATSAWCLTPHSSQSVGRYKQRRDFRTVNCACKWNSTNTCWFYLAWIKRIKPIPGIVLSKAISVNSLHVVSVYTGSGVTRAIVTHPSSCYFGLIVSPIALHVFSLSSLWISKQR